MSSDSENTQLDLWKMKSTGQGSFASEIASDSSSSPEQEDMIPRANKALNPDFASRRPLNILVADDNEINRKVIRVILQKLGYECSEATTGEEALKVFRKEPIDYIFMDLDMPELSGIAASETIRELETSETNERVNKAEIIAVTANISTETRLKCRRAGMNGYLEKPITTEMIKEQLLRSWPRIRTRRAKTQSQTTIGI